MKVLGKISLVLFIFCFALVIVGYWKLKNITNIEKDNNVLYPSQETIQLIGGAIVLIRFGSILAFIFVLLTMLFLTGYDLINLIIKDLKNLIGINLYCF